jgi:RNA polymerase sigma factor (sigma-70 family)
MTKTTTFERLISDVAAGSEEAVWQLLETYTPYIVRAVRLSMSAKLRRKFDSQDIAQTLWASLLLGNTDFANLKSPERLIAFLARAAKNKVIDRTRRLNTQKYAVTREETLDFQTRNPNSARRPAKGIYARDSTPSKVVTAHEHWDVIVSRATKRDQRILNMRLEGFSFDEIGQELRISSMTARRAIEGLVEQLTE